MLCHGIAGGPVASRPTIDDIANAPFIGTGWRHDKPESISGKEEFSDLCATCARSVLVIAAAGVFLLAQATNVVVAGLDHSRSKNGVAEPVIGPRYARTRWLAYAIALRRALSQCAPKRDGRDKPGHDNTEALVCLLGASRDGWPGPDFAFGLRRGKQARP
jgi:hypothetical protein